MATQIVPFSFESHEVRVVVDDGTPWFIARDIAETLGYQNPSEAVADHCKYLKILKTSKSLPQVPSRGYQIIPESDVYRLVMRSKLEAAERFQDWVCEEVLPSIRKTGKYEAPSVATRASFKDSMFFAKEIAKALRLSETSKLRMYKAVSEEYGVPLALLPSYSSEGLTRSLTDLLTQFGVGVSAVQANKVLLHLGILEELERPSRKSGGVKKFKSITQSGSRYGKNETSPENPNETQPRWYAETAEDLVALIKRELEMVA